MLQIVRSGCCSKSVPTVPVTDQQQIEARSPAPESPNHVDPYIKKKLFCLVNRQHEMPHRFVRVGFSFHNRS